MVVACIAVAIALTGTSFAATNLIGSAQIADNSILSKDIRDGTLREVDFAPTALPAAVMAYKDDFGLTTHGNAFVQAARLPLGPGEYVIFAKLATDVSEPGQTGNESVTCDLVAGADSDSTFASHDALSPYSGLSLVVLHEFTTPGTAVLNCGHPFAAASTVSYMGLSGIKLTAIKVGGLTNPENLKGAPSP